MYKTDCNFFCACVTLTAYAVPRDARWQTLKFDTAQSCFSYREAFVHKTRTHREGEVVVVVVGNWSSVLEFKVSSSSYARQTKSHYVCACASLSRSPATITVGNKHENKPPRARASCVCMCVVRFQNKKQQPGERFFPTSSFVVCPVFLPPSVFPVFVIRPHLSVVAATATYVVILIAHLSLLFAFISLISLRSLRRRRRRTQRHTRVAFFQRSRGGRLLHYFAINCSRVRI